MTCEVVDCDQRAGYWISEAESKAPRVMHVCADCGLELTARKQWRLVKVEQ